METNAGIVCKGNKLAKSFLNILRGRASIQVTLDIYSHVAPGLQQAAANRFDDILLPTEDTARESIGQQMVGKMMKPLVVDKTSGGLLASIFGGAEWTEQRTFRLAFRLAT